MPLSEPLDDYWPRLKCFKEVDVFGGGGRGGYCHIINLEPPTCLLIIIHLPQLEFCKKTNVIYQLKCPLGDSTSESNNIYVI